MQLTQFFHDRVSAGCPMVLVTVFDTAGSTYSKAGGQMLIDGDGLTAVAPEPDRLRNRRAPTVLTPHPGELSRLIGRPVAEILADQVASARSAAASASSRSARMRALCS